MPKPKDEPETRAQKMTRRLRTAGKVADTAGRAGAALGRGSGAGAIAVAAEGAAGALSKLGPAGAVAGAAVETLTKGFQAASAATDAFVQRARELEQFSGTLAAANAQSDIIRMQNEMREARDLEGPLSELAVNQARLETTISELLRPIKEFVINILNGAIEIGIDAVRGILSGINDLLSYFASRSDRIDRILARLDAADGPIRDVIELWVLDEHFAPAPGPVARPHRDDRVGPLDHAPGLGIPLLVGGGL